MTPPNPTDPTTHEPSPNAGLAGVGEMGGSNASHGQPQTASAGGAMSAAGLASKQGGIEGFLDRQLQVVAQDLESFARLLTDTLDGSDPKFRQSFRSTIDPLSGKISQLAETIRGQDANELINRTKETVKTHPLAVVGGIAALAAGLAQVAVVMARRSEGTGASMGSTSTDTGMGGTTGSSSTGTGTTTGASTGMGSSISMGSGSSDVGSPGTSGLGGSSGGMSH